jgi:hypothetical protein
LCVLLGLLAGARDSLVDARERIQQMSEAERAALIQHRREFEQLSPHQQNELRELFAELQALPAERRSHLESLMRRIQITLDVATEAQRREFMTLSLDSQRFDLLKRMISDQNALAAHFEAKVPTINQGARELFALLNQFDANKGGPVNAARDRKNKAGVIKPASSIFVQRVKKSGDPDNQKLLELLQNAEVLDDRLLLTLCLNERLSEGDAQPEFDFVYSDIRFSPRIGPQFRLVMNAIPHLPKEKTIDQLSPSERRLVWNAISQLYLLQGDSNLPTKLGKMRPKDLAKKGMRSIITGETVLNEKVKLFHKYQENPSLIPAIDKKRFEKLLSGKNS